jgi:GT2 family glycosyltransferase
MSERVTLVMCLYDQLSITRTCLQSLRLTTEPFRLIVIDNGSTDGTRGFLKGLDVPYPLRLIFSESNVSVIASLNRAWRAAETEFLCLLHNDTEMLEPEWLARLLRALDDPQAGLAGLYGAKRIRKDGRLVGRTIIHSLASGPTVRAPWEEVAVVDGVCLCLRRNLMDSVGGLDEGYGFFHGYDKDLSLAVREVHRRCLVVHAPFLHRGGGTRARDFAAHPQEARRDVALRDTANDRFAAKWRQRLPCDVRSRSTRVRDWLSSRLLRTPRR